MFALAATSCSSGSNAASPSGASTPSTPPSEAQLTTGADQPLTLTPAQLLAATGGATPVAFASPAHGKISYGAGGTMVYTPEKGFSGTDELKVTTAEAVNCTPPTARRSPPSAGWRSRAAPRSAIAAVPGSTDEVYGLSDRGPNVDGRTDDEKVLPVPDFQPSHQRVQAQRRDRHRREDHRADGYRRRAAAGARRSAGEHRRDIWSTSTARRCRPPITASTPRDWSRCPTAPSGCPTSTGRSSSTSTRPARELERLSPFAGSLPRELSLRTPNRGDGGPDHHPRRLDAGRDHAVGAPRPLEKALAKSVGVTTCVAPSTWLTKAVGRIPLPPGQSARKTKVAVSEITALTNTTFLVDERDGEAASGCRPSWSTSCPTSGGATDVGPKGVGARVRRTTPPRADCRSRQGPEHGHRWGSPPTPRPSKR